MRTRESCDQQEDEVQAHLSSKGAHTEVIETLKVDDSAVSSVQPGCAVSTIEALALEANRRLAVQYFLNKDLPPAEDLGAWNYINNLLGNIWKIIEDKCPLKYRGSFQRTTVWSASLRKLTILGTNSFQEFF